MERSRVKELADGRPYTGQQALELGLIDALGDLPDGIDAAADLAEIKGEPDVIEYRQSPSLLDTWLGARQRESGDVALLEWLEVRSVVPQARYIGR
jgi:protease-4